MCNEVCQQDAEPLPLLQDWSATARNAVLNVIEILLRRMPLMSRPIIQCPHPTCRIGQEPQATNTAPKHTTPFLRRTHSPSP